MSLEHIPPLEEDVSETTDTTVEELLEQLEKRDETLKEQEGATKELILGIEPTSEEHRAKLEELKERLEALTPIREDVEAVGKVQALEAAIGQLGENQENVSVEQLMELFQEFPDLAEAFVNYLIKEKASFKTSTGVKAEDIENAIEDLKGNEQKIVNGLVLRSLERVLRAIVSAATLGIGALVYDCIKDGIITARKHKEVRDKKKKLMSSTALSSGTVPPPAAA